MKICLIPQVHGIGGMVSFRHRLAEGLRQRGFEVCHHLQEAGVDVALIIGGTRDLAGVWRARRRGVRIVQRLNGMNWIHRRRRTGLRHFLRAEYGNWILAALRARLADAIVYQSEFARRWWEMVHRPTAAPARVIYNGVDLSVYTPHGAHSRPLHCYRLLLVEGTLGGGYEGGLETAVTLAERLDTLHRAALGLPVELMVVGRVASGLRQAWEQRAKSPLQFVGALPPERIPEIDRSAHLLFSADVNSACPNAVIEALACGLPVVAFDTGALPELVSGDAGRIMPYGGNPWRLDPPDVPLLAEAAVEVLRQQPHFRTAARQRAEQAFALETMIEQYLEVFQQALSTLPAQP